MKIIPVRAIGKCDGSRHSYVNIVTPVLWNKKTVKKKHLGISIEIVQYVLQEIEKFISSSKNENTL